MSLVYCITPSAGCALNMTYPVSTPVGGTGPQMPTPAAEFGMQVGKVVTASDSHRYILVNSGTTAIAAAGTITVGAPDFIQGGTGTGLTVKNTSTVAIGPAATLFWGQLTASTYP